MDKDSCPELTVRINRNIWKKDTIVADGDIIHQNDPGVQLDPFAKSNTIAKNTKRPDTHLVGVLAIAAYQTTAVNPSGREGLFCKMQVYSGNCQDRIVHRDIWL